MLTAIAKLTNQTQKKKLISLSTRFRQPKNIKTNLMAILKIIISNTVHQILVLHLSLSYYQNPTVLKLKTQKLSILNMKKHYFHSIGYCIFIIFTHLSLSALDFSLDMISYLKQKLISQQTKQH